jgi:hypothetical protein
MSQPNTFILQDVINDLIDTDKSLTGPLMKLNYFARLTDNKPLLQFTQNELNGYKGEDGDIPDYRKSLSKLIVSTQAHVHRHDVELPITMLDKPFQEALKYIAIREGIGTIEKMTIDFTGSSGNKEIGRPVPMEMLQYIQPSVRQLYKTDARIDVIGAKLTCNGYVIISILSNVRERLLNFVMEIAKEFSYDISIDSFNKQQEKNNQIIIHQMNTTINNKGDGNVINTGDNATVHANISISKGDIQSLKDQLLKYGIEEADAQELTEIVQSEQPSVGNNTLGEKSNNWILKIIGKSLSGVGKIAVGISSNILATLIKQYYGMNG